MSARMQTYLARLFVSLMLSLLVAPVHAVPSVSDDLGRTIKVESPVKRIISLAPHVTELLYAIGVGDRIVGTVSFSDYPAAAKKIPRVGSYNKFDMESIIALQPDLIVAWQSGNPQDEVEQLIKLGFNVFITEPRALEDVGKVMIKLGQVLGAGKVAQQQALQYDTRLAELRARYKDRSRVRVFYQVWNEPLFTINGEHIISHVMDLCGGENVFGELAILAPRVSVEAVIQADPDAIVAGMNESRKDWLAEWQRWGNMKAVKNHHLYAIDADLIVRHTPRILQGVELMCQHLEKVRLQ